MLLRTEQQQQSHLASTKCEQLRYQGCQFSYALLYSTVVVVVFICVGAALYNMQCMLTCWSVQLDGCCWLHFPW
jgi:hypothetical protein